MGTPDEQLDGLSSVIRRCDRVRAQHRRAVTGQPKRGVLTGPEVKRAAHLVTAAAGGSAAVREVCEVLLRAQGKWAEILKKYEAE